MPSISVLAALRGWLFAALFLLAGAAAASQTIVVMGDSLSAGYGLAPGQAWPALLDKRLAEQRLDYSVANLSVSGETTAGGRSRLPEALQRLKPVVVVLVLGANDGLRGLSLSQMRDNLEAMIAAARKVRARVLLVGMRLPPNYGPYAGEFHEVFKSIARKQQLPLVDFLLAPVVGDERNFLPDRLHPTAAAQPLLLDHLWPSLKPLLP